MRKHGVPNFPDPDSQGRIKITFGIQNGHKTGVDTSSAQFATAQNACKSLQPNGGKPNAQTQAKEIQQALAFAKCMRSHGVKFPDPQVGANGGTKVSIGPDVANSPQFKPAQQACQTLVPGGPMSQGGTP
jgi:hypothetical protein